MLLKRKGLCNQGHFCECSMVTQYMFVQVKLNWGLVHKRPRIQKAYNIYPYGFRQTAKIWHLSYIMPILTFIFRFLVSLFGGLRFLP